MPLITLNLSDNFVSHIDGYQHHFKFRTRAEAIRALFLKAFALEGNPLDEPISIPTGRPSNKAADVPAFVGKVEEVPKREPITREAYFEMFGVEPPEDFDPTLPYVGAFKNVVWDV